jgi:dienelactone hydrolase
MPVRRILAVLLAAFTVGALHLPAAEPTVADQLQKLNAVVLPADGDAGKKLAQMLPADARGRIRAANQRETRAWQAVQSREDWERYRDPRLQKLRESLGAWPAAPKDLKVRVTRTIDGDGYKIENLTFESRPGLLVTANLYTPKEPGKSMPGIVICPSHHNPKTQGELQDMGMSWARLGCLVLVPDNLGHGERRQHPFIDKTSYPEEYRVGRQDYYFRYNTSLQLYAVGESLAGWIVWDLLRGVDLLLSRPGVDKERIILFGSVAGGGDPSAVAAALDPRITCVAPFNFGGPQPETMHPLPADAEDRFNYAGGGSWESTRNLRLSVRDGFMPWVIVGGAAPRRLIYAHEFKWDKDHDPVWKRLGTIYDLYKVPDHRAGMNGSGAVTGKTANDTHCNNIGPVHRREMYPYLNKWFSLGASSEKEYRTRHKSEELQCATADSGIKMRPMVELAAALGAERAAAARQRLEALSADERRAQLRKDWVRLLGDVEPRAEMKATAGEPRKVGDIRVDLVTLQVEPDIVVPLLVLVPAHKEGTRLPVVVGVAQQGKHAFLQKRADTVAELLAGGAAVCLPDLRGTGETRPGDGRGYNSGATSISASELMLGQTLVGSRLRDLRSVLKYLRERKDVDAGQLALWGDSTAPVNDAKAKLELPLELNQPPQAEPLGELLALLGGLFEPEVKAVYAQGGLAGYQSILQSQFLHVPHDAVVPGAITVGDLGAVAAALAPRPLRLEGLVDGLNRRATADAVSKAFAPAQSAYRAAAAQERLTIEAEPGRGVSAWLLAQLKAK